MARTASRLSDTNGICCAARHCHKEKHNPHIYAHIRTKTTMCGPKQHPGGRYNQYWRRHSKDILRLYHKRGLNIWLNYCVHTYTHNALYISFVWCSSNLCATTALRVWGYIYILKVKVFRVRFSVDEEKQRKPVAWCYVRIKTNYLCEEQCFQFRHIRSALI